MILKEFSITQQQEGHILNSFIVCPGPFIQFKNLDQTIVHYSQKQSKLKFRPKLKSFLQNIKQAQVFQIGIFTAAIFTYAQAVLNALNVNNYFSFVLTRQHVYMNQKGICKDLSRIGRNLDYTILIDDKKQNLQMQLQNGIHITPWTGGGDDKSLEILGQLLKQGAKTQLPSTKWVSLLNQKYRLSLKVLSK